MSGEREGGIFFSDTRDLQRTCFNRSPDEVSTESILSLIHATCTVCEIGGMNKKKHAVVFEEI